MFTRKIFSKNYISENFSENLFPLVLWPYFSLGAPGEIFYGKLFPFSRVVARQGYLGIFGGPWGTLGGTEGKKFYAKNFLQKLYIRKCIFRNFLTTCFRSCCGPIGVFTVSLGAPSRRQGVLRGKIFTINNFSKYCIPDNYFSDFF